MQLTGLLLSDDKLNSQVYFDCLTGFYVCLTFMSYLVDKPYQSFTQSTGVNDGGP